MEQAINVQSLAQKRRTYFKHPGSLIVFLLTWLAALLTMGVLVFLIGYILIKGVPFLTPDLFKLEYNSDNASGVDQYTAYDSVSLVDRRTAWHLCSNLYG